MISLIYPKEHSKFSNNYNFISTKFDNLTKAMIHIENELNHITAFKYAGGGVVAMILGLILLETGSSSKNNEGVKPLPRDKNYSDSE